VTYDAGGRIRSRSDVGNYAYVATRPGAVSSIAGGPRGAMAFSYDANGNMVERQGRPITWTSFLQPRRISHGSSDYAEFSYGPERQRIRQVAGNAGVTTTTHYVNPRFEVELRGSSRRYRSNVYANGKVVYSLVEQDNPLTAEGYFLHRDHQDSVDTLTRVVGAGSDVSRLQFDAWGKRRNANWSADFADQRAVDAHFTERGYTGHEHLDNVRLIHMDGRLQDPQLGVMLSPDPVLGNLADPQTLNRYAYAAGNPSSSQDPSGFLLDRIGRFFKRLTGHVGSFVRRVVRNYGREIAAAITAYYTWSGVAEAYVAQAGAAGVATGNTLGAVAGGAAGGAVATGNLRGVLGGAVGGGLFGAIDVAYGSQWPATRIAAHAVAGGIGVEIAGGDFRRGALLAGGLASARYVYNHVVGYDATFASGEPAQAKGRFDLPHEGVNNIGPAVRVIDPDALWNEGGRASRLLNRIPGVNAVAGLHDVFQVGLDVAGGARYGGFLRNALNFPGMPVAAAMTYPALLDGYPAIVLATDER
jgi:RHS repeat-associated protein